ncbi:MAG: hypothetical protein ACXWQZ_17600, partial [Ktedonobacterales bacterium]
RGQADYLRKRNLLGAVSTLLNPHGLGGFRVLVQQRGVPGAGRELLGLRREAAPREGGRMGGVGAWL